MFEDCRSGSLRVNERHKWILKSSQSGAGPSELAGGRGRSAQSAAATVAATGTSGLSPGRREVVRRPGRDGAAALASLTAGGGRKGLGSARTGGDAEVSGGCASGEGVRVPSRPARPARTFPFAAFKS